MSVILNKNLKKLVFKEKEKNSEKNIIISSDFETITYNKKLYVYVIGLLWETSNYYEFTINLEGSLENIETESNKLISDYFSFIFSKFSKKDRLFIYFHNLGLFDGYFLMQYLIDFYDSNQINCLIKDDKIYYIKFKNITFLDSYNIIPYSLDEIGKIFFNKKKPLNIMEYNNLELIKRNITLIRKYLFHDVVTLYNAITHFRNTFLLENVEITKKFTISSISFYIYRMKFLRENVIRTTRFSNFIFLKKAYLGGINHIFIPFLKNGYYYDINSLYPYVMKTCKMPLGDFNIIKENFKDLNNYFGFIHCTIYINKNIKIHPLLLKIGKRENIQATGMLTGVWFSEEIKYSLSLGAQIIEIFKIYNFEEKKIIFDEFVNNFYEKRINSKNKIDNTLYKLLLNSLYGKFGTNLNYNKIIKINKEDMYSYQLTHTFLNIFSKDLYNIKVDYEMYTLMSNQVDQIENEEEKNKIKKILLDQKNKFSKDNICVHISAAISSYARIKLVKDINLLNELGHQICYYDTDSIFTDKKLPDYMISKNELGKYKLVDVIKEAYFISPKVYAYLNEENIEVLRFKGLQKEFKEQHININDFKNIYNSMKEIEDNKIDLEKYTYNKLKKNLTHFSIYQKEIDFKPIFTSRKYINIYNNNIWIHTQLIHINNYLYFFKNIFYFLKNILKKQEYYKMIFDLFF